jgi:hypothetical protein
MLIEATFVKALPDYKLLVGFETGEEKVCDFSRRLARPAFRKLKNAALFGKAHIEGGAVVWNDEIDIAPETLYEEGRPVRRAGRPARGTRGAGFCP